MASSTGDSMRPARGYREYRLCNSRFAQVGLLVAFGAVGLLVTVGVDDDMSATFKFWLLALGLAAFALMLAWARVTATRIGPAGVTVRSLLRTRTYAWTEVQDLRIEFNPGAAAGAEAPRHTAVLYDAAGHRLVLPHVNDKNLAVIGCDLAGELDAMRTMWLAGRGADWSPVARVQRRVQERTRYGVSSWVVGLSSAMLAMPVAVVLFVIGLFTRASGLPAPWSWPFQPAAIAVVPALVFPLAAAVSIWRRRH